MKKDEQIEFCLTFFRKIIFRLILYSFSLFYFSSCSPFFSSLKFSKATTAVCPAGVVVPNIESAPNDLFDENAYVSSFGGLTQLKSHIPKAVMNSYDLGERNLSDRISFSVSVQLKNTSDLSAFVQQLSDPSSENYHHFLSHTEFKERFYRSEEEFHEIEQALNTNQIETFGHQGTLIFASASVEAVEKFFNTKIDYFLDPNGTIFFAPKYELQIPSDLAIHSVHGLNNLNIAHKHLKKRALPRGAGVNIKSGFTPSEVRKIYNIPDSLTGAGQTVALVELDGYKQSDITRYEQCYNYGTRSASIDYTRYPCGSVTPISSFPIPSPTIIQSLVCIRQGGSQLCASGNPGQNSDEVTLDIEMVIAMAPAAKIIVYEGPNTTYASVRAVYNQIISDTVNAPKIVSTSWGIPEMGSNGLPAAELDDENMNVFQTMFAQGQTIFAAAGDTGAFDDLNHGSCSLLVDDPAVQPYVIGVGGTSLQVASDGAYSNETVWNRLSFGYGAGGGGISQHFAIPAWQKNIIQGNEASSVFRNVPDVALNSDPLTGYAVFWTNIQSPTNPAGQWYQMGGTSAAAPLWAGFLALVNQQRSQAQLGNLPTPVIAFYQIAQSQRYLSDFHDIADGQTNGYYTASSGYDNATGLGSLNGANLLIDLSSGFYPRVD